MVPAASSCRASCNVFEAIGLWQGANSCILPEPDGTRSLAIYTIKSWARCDPDATLSFALHEGGHSIPKGWAKMAVDWFDAQTRGATSFPRCYQRRTRAPISVDTSVTPPIARPYQVT